ncbi:E3 ubiquitin-protein ligase At1g63170-like isoform X2 [Chenopodium quinoa]|uniref:E3 ubiquitin-protein ligase At1g63170-like isoform X2 n=1 Tax=Chenopodium quinoa TaxID=63459 RepID=UPI000B7732DC|nr:E3 ubiquitin-protein ligase At1g63170-like isoform X2 [Chenopodium quinoa]
MSSLDATPFLSPVTPDLPATMRAQGLRHAARMIRRASGGRRSMRAPSMAVRETAAQEIEERQIDWAYSSPVVALDAAWNSAFVLAASAALFLTWSDTLRLPLRVWIVGYALQCLLHVFCVCVEFRRRRRVRNAVEHGRDDYFEESSTKIKHLESANTLFSFMWWILGFYWICVGGQALQQDSPTLYWLCIAFLVLDLFFVIFCVALASVIAAAVCCCLPCIIAILYVLADRAGASKEDIDLLKKYTFHRDDCKNKNDEETEEPSGGIMKECGTECPIEHNLTAEDAECCICLSAYEDGIELRELPCGHHFHSSCVEKWLHINSTCPLCKYDISKRYSPDGEV